MGEQRVSGGGRIELESLSKWYGEQQVLDAIDLIIEPGEFFSLLGPSGCGKTTTLRLIGGFEEIEHGAVRIDGADMRGVPPEKRPVNTVFQSYALFPHKSVAENVAFGLRFQPCDKAETKRRVGEALELVRLTGYEARKPQQLSGGQRQRVAMGRAIVRDAELFLMDEPLSNLDALLREQMRVEIKRIQRSLGITAVYVTHDRVEAMSLSDRVIVMKDGKLRQLGAPDGIYEKPDPRFVAGFVGTSNLLRGEATLTLGGERRQARAGTWVHMPRHLPHTVVAHTLLIMLLLLYRAAGEK